MQRFRVVLVVLLFLVALACVGSNPSNAASSASSASSAASEEGPTVDPAGLVSLLSQANAVAPGTTIRVTGGSYQGCVPSALQGAPDAPIIVRAVDGQRPVFDGAGCTQDSVLDIRGADIWFWGLEITNSDPDRTAQNPGSQPADLKRAAGVAMRAPRTKLINSFVHDNGNGVGMWDGAVDSELYGCVVTHNGWVGPDRGHGHGIYVQNSQGTKQISNSVVADNYDIGFHAYGQAGRTEGIHVDGLVAYDNGEPVSNGGLVRAANVFVGTTQYPANDFSMTNSVLYQASQTISGGARIGYGVDGNSGLVLQGNTFANGAQALEIQKWANATVTDNTFVADTAPSYTNANSYIAMTTLSGPTTWDRNTYFDTSSMSQGERVGFTYNDATYKSGSRLTYDAWRAATGFDGASSYSQSVPSGQWTWVRQNAYEPTRFLVTTLGWDGEGPGAADIGATGVQPGQRYVASDPNNPGQAIEGHWSGEAVPTFGAGRLRVMQVDLGDAPSTGPTDSGPDNGAPSPTGAAAPPTGLEQPSAATGGGGVADDGAALGDPAVAAPSGTMTVSGRGHGSTGTSAPLLAVAAAGALIGGNLMALRRIRQRRPQLFAAI